MSTTGLGAPGERKRAARRLVIGAVIAFVVIFALAAVVAVALNGDNGGESGAPAAAAPVAEGTGTPAPTTTTGSQPSPAGWDVAAENALAARPMVQFSVEAAQPHNLATHSAGPPIALPASTVRTGPVPQGFPHTPEGALAQLKALDEAGMVGLDPAAYTLAYQQLALPGAPDVANVGLVQVAASARLAGGAEPTGPLTGLTSTFQVDAGLIKGVADGGNFVVPCVLGELSVISPKSTARAGVGDCQALRWVDGTWRISPTSLPNNAPSAWPGTEEAVTAGYRGVSGNA